MNEQTNTETDDAVARYFQREKPVTCEKCNQRFDTWPSRKKNLQAKNMHMMRMHTRAGKLGALKGVAASSKKRNPSTSLWKSNTKAYRKQKYREMVERYRRAGLNAHGEPFKDNAISRGLRRGQQLRQQTRKASTYRRLQYVYPLPDEQKVLEQPETQKPIHAKLHHCPACGEDLTKWKKE